MSSLHTVAQYLYTMPEQYGTHDYLCHIDDEVIEACRNECVLKGYVPCYQDIYDLCTIIMTDNIWTKTADARSARELYISLRREVLNLI